MESRLAEIEVKLTFKAAGANAAPMMENLMPAGVKLSVTGTPACCEVSTTKLMAAAAPAK